MSQTWDAIIGGAGPAGLIAATTLSRAGGKVLLLDPQSSGRHKVGESVPGAMARLLAKLNLPPIGGPGSPHRSVGGIVSHWAGELRTEDHLSKPEGGGWRLNRGAFEAELAQVAAAVGVMRKPARVTGVERINGVWQMDTEAHGKLAADFLIDATGRNAAIARRAGARQIHGPPLVAVWTIGRNTRETPPNRTFIESTAEGWWYAAYLPDGRPLTVFHTTPALAADLRAHPMRWLEQLRATRHIAAQVDPEAFYRMALKVHDARSCHLESPCGPGWAACGDAALAFDPLASQGIFNAMASADMVATALLGNTTLEHYQRTAEEVRSLYQRRRNPLYAAAARHFGTPFWQLHADRDPIADGVTS
ncbi:tryptophan 7-halogenase [Luteolibacter sp. LG18]|uniref:NAD(P)/FAD-dependent oxidoreductase n=1 Tax=Luteolibacter sp. LG18 TaxID=2819286 RepID=UPI002B312E58|nr:hypothetical protein llg_44340 [Luteolibacter sp. LG18]